MNPKKLIATCLALLLTTVLIVGCGGGGSDRGEGSEGSEGQEGGEGGGEAGEGGHSEGGEGGEGGEESATQYQIDETADIARAGVRLILAYDPDTNAFVGTAENTTSGVLQKVRVEVHLSNGTELGPTTPVDVKPSQTIDINLPAPAEPFTTWGAHPEVG
jgi:hypothetical protein